MLKESIGECRIKPYVFDNNEMHELLYKDQKIKFSHISYGFYKYSDFINYFKQSDDDEIQNIVNKITSINDDS